MQGKGEEIGKVLDRLRRQCSRREYCSSDILRKAAEALGKDYDAASEVLRVLVEERYVDDLRYASAFARDKSSIAGWGEVKIRYMLSAKGVAKKVIDEALQEIDRPKADMRLEKLLENEVLEDGNEYNRILLYLNEYYTSADLEDICCHFHRSPSHISHLFKKQTGMTLRAYCNKLKLEKAKSLLETTDMPITQIALDVGFNDVSYFINLFRQKNGVSPLVYRKNIDK